MLLETLVISLWVKRVVTIYRALFNVAAPAVSIWYLAHCFSLSRHPAIFDPFVAPAALFAPSLFSRSCISSSTVGLLPLR